MNCIFWEIFSQFLRSKTIRLRLQTQFFCLTHQIKKRFSVTLDLFWSLHYRVNPATKYLLLIIHCVFDALNYQYNDHNHVR